MEDECCVGQFYSHGGRLARSCLFASDVGKWADVEDDGGVQLVHFRLCSVVDEIALGSIVIAETKRLFEKVAGSTRKPYIRHAGINERVNPWRRYSGHSALKGVYCGNRLDADGQTPRVIGIKREGYIVGNIACLVIPT